MGASLKMQADGQGYGMRSRKFFKRVKMRSERRKAKLNPECPSGYKRYSGYLL